ncbi:MAG: hypothetical protein Q4E62_07440 [Sutterellaceae bacterium]|nr:hypothetical protein [Sutterellaceae bacterium]
MITDIQKHRGAEIIDLEGDLQRFFSEAESRNGLFRFWNNVRLIFAVLCIAMGLIASIKSLVSSFGF